MSDAYLGLTPEFWLFGFIPTLYTNDWKAGLALVFIIEYAINLFAVHGQDATDAASCTELLYMATTVHATAAILGTLVGCCLVYASGFPGVFNIDVFFSSPQRSIETEGHVHLKKDKNNTRTNDLNEAGPWNPKAYGWNVWGLVVPFSALYASVLLFIGRFTMIGARSITQDTSNIIGGIALGLAILLLAIYIIMSGLRRPSTRFPDGHSESALLNIKYAVLFVLIMATPVVFDFTNGLAAGWRFLLHMLAATLVYALTAWLGQMDRYLGVVSSSRLGWTFLVIWFVHLSMYVASAVFTSQDSIFAWVAAWSLVWSIVFVIYGATRKPSGSYERVPVSKGMMMTRSKARTAKNRFDDIEL